MSGVVVAVHRADEYSTRRATVDFNLFDGPARYLIGLTYLGRLPSATKAAQR
jgi:hypothetical protein